MTHNHKTGNTAIQRNLGLSERNHYKGRLVKEPRPVEQA